MSFDDFIGTLKTGVVDMFGTSALYTPVSGDSVTCLVNLEFEVELSPESYEIEIVEIGTTIEAEYSEIGLPKRGSTFVVGANTYTVRRIESNDQVFVKVVVSED